MQTSSTVSGGSMEYLFQGRNKQTGIDGNAALCRHAPSLQGSGGNVYPCGCTSIRGADDDFDVLAKRRQCLHQALQRDAAKLVASNRRNLGLGYAVEFCD